MSRTLSPLQLRREWLIATADVQRHEIALFVYRLQTPISVIDRGVGLVRVFLRYRLPIAGAGLILIGLNRKEAGKVSRSLWSALLLTMPRYAWLIKQIAGLATRKPVPERQARRG